MSSIYLDYAAATPLDPDVQKAMEPFWSEQFYNPSATYKLATEVRIALNEARAQIGYWLGARPTELVFTAGGTEANNLAIHGVMRAYPESNIVISGIEHESVIEPAAQYDVRIVGVKADGRVDMDELHAKIDEHTVLVSIMYANNEIGTIQNLRKISTLIDEFKKSRQVDLPLYFHTDACQAANFLDVHVSRLGVDLMTLNGGKIYGPKQSGCLYIKTGVELTALINGGGQERGLRSGTENVPAIVGFAAALDIAQRQRNEESERLRGLQREFVKQLGNSHPVIAINGSMKFRLPNNMHITFPGHDNERLLFGLDEVGILAAAGSACTASNEEPSHVLAAIGISEDDARASLRLTMGRQTTYENVERVVQAFASLVK